MCATLAKQTKLKNCYFTSIKDVHFYEFVLCGQIYQCTVYTLYVSHPVSKICMYCTYVCKTFMQERLFDFCLCVQI